VVRWGKNEGSVFVRLESLSFISTEYGSVFCVVKRCYQINLRPCLIENIKTARNSLINV
jgi:hypothetical protein